MEYRALDVNLAGMFRAILVFIILGCLTQRFFVRCFNLEVRQRRFIDGMERVCTSDEQSRGSKPTGTDKATKDV
jgi:hypothetical protein